MLHSSSTMMDKISLVFNIIIQIGDKIATLVKAAGLNIKSYWPKLFAKAVEGQDIATFFKFGGEAASVSAPVPVAKVAAK